MAGDTYYAWSNFNVTPDNWTGNPRDVTKVAPGDKVSAADLGIDDEEFQQYIDNGAVRTIAYPDMGTFSGSPVEWARARLVALAEGGYFETQFGAVGTDTPPEVDPETGKAIAPGTNAG